VNDRNDAPPALSAPFKLHQSHAVAAFDCGSEPLNQWLKRRALPNIERGISQTFVVCDATRVVGYYSLAGGAVYHADAIRKVKGNAPDPVPVVVLGRLAVDNNYRSKGVGKGLLKDAVLRAANAGQSIGLRAMLVHAKDDDAVAFYRRYGFKPSPSDPYMLMVTMREIAGTLGSG
jgi:GNAT superfamily N-acetyltransferase